MQKNSSALVNIRKSGSTLTDLLPDHMLSVDAHCEKLRTHPRQGLSLIEAEARLLRDGPNVLTKRKKTPKVLLFLKEMFTGFGPLYWAAAILCILSYQPLGGPEPSIYNLVLGVIIAVVLVGTSAFRFAQLQSASNLMKLFMDMMPRMTKVLRDGRWVDIAPENLVVGDVIMLLSGDKFPADVRAIEVAQAKVDNSSLTGESLGVRLTVEGTDNQLNESRNIGFLGTNLVEGTLTAVVISTGDNTTMGKLARLSVTTKRKLTTLERDVYYFTFLVGVLSVAFCALIVLYWVFYLNVKYPGAISLSTLLTTCTGVIVALVPDGLAIAVTATLMMVAKSMRNVNVIVKDLNIIDTLGATTIICSDKTGTITQNKMTLAHTWMLDDADEATSSGDQSPKRRISAPALVGRTELFGALNLIDMTANKANGWLAFILGLGGLCNNALLDPLSKNISGSPTEAALLTAANGNNNMTKMRTAMPMLSQIPFDSARKYQLNVHRFTDYRMLVTDQALEVLDEQCKSAKTLAIMKGGSEIIIETCSTCIYQGDVTEFSPSFKRKALDAMNALADCGERVLGISYCLLDEPDIDAERDEEMLRSKMTFVGLVALTDPPRVGVAEAIDKCRTAGIKVAMVTGDHPATASAIARKVNIIKGVAAPIRIAEIREDVGKPTFDVHSPVDDRPVIVLGKELAALTEDEWLRLMKYREFVFARTTPENKMDIVKHFQSNGEIVAATGDGVNDSAALKRADIGIAMGIMGTEISKDAANVILQDDNFGSIVNGIQAGRLLFTNLRKVVCYLLPAGSFSEIIPVLGYMFLGFPLPLSAFLMIIICMVTDVIGSLGLVHELPEADIMRRKPRNTKKQHLVDVKVILFSYGLIGILESVIAFFTYFVTMWLAGGCTPADLLFAFQWGLPPATSTVLTNTTVNGTLVAVETIITANSTIFCNTLDYEAQLSLVNIGQTSFFCSLVICQCWNLMFCCRTRRASAFKQPLRREVLLYVYGEISVVFYCAYFPFMNNALQTGPINYYCYLIPLGLGSIIMAAEELRKFFVRRYPRSWLAKIAW